MISVAFADFVQKIEEKNVLIDDLQQYAVEQLKKASGQDGAIRDAWMKLDYSSQIKIANFSKVNQDRLGGQVRVAR